MDEVKDIIGDYAADMFVQKSRVSSLFVFVRRSLGSKYFTI